MKTLQMFARVTLVFFIASLFSSCVKDGPDAPSGLIPLNAPQKVLADKIISCFENDNPEIQYGYIENLNDGRGYTAGRAGFTTATGDLLVVVQLYTDSVPSNTLAQFLPRLQTLASSQSAAVDGLEQLPSNWLACASDPVFRYVQDKVSDSLYYRPAVQYAQEIGARYPLTLLCIYDACIQHGDGDDPDGLSAMMDEASRKAGKPVDGDSEAKWIRTFNHIRRKTLKHPDNKDTRDEWRESTGRVDALEELRKSENFLLDQVSVEINPYGTIHRIQL